MTRMIMMWVINSKIVSSVRKRTHVILCAKVFNASSAKPGIIVIVLLGM